MSYSTPHHAHEYLKAACLAIVHSYTLAAQRKNSAEVLRMVCNKREIDFNARLGLFFGPEASLAAQGTSDLDLLISSPTIKAEVKFLRRKADGKQPVNIWGSKKGPKHDWEWLLGLTNEGDAFKKHALVFFVPGQDVISFEEACRIRPAGTKFTRHDYAPFVNLVKPDPGNPKSLIYTSKPNRDYLINIGNKCVRRQMVGSLSSPVYALIYSRVGHHEYEHLTHFSESKKI